MSKFVRRHGSHEVSCECSENKYRTDAVRSAANGNGYIATGYFALSEATKLIASLDLPNE